MIINNLSIAKVAKDDPRYPAPSDCPKPVSDIYLFTAETENGPVESPFYVFTEMTADMASGMLRLFAGALQRHAMKDAA